MAVNVNTVVLRKDDDDDDEAFQSQVAVLQPLPKPDDDLSLPPVDGHAYIRRAIAERKLCKTPVTVLPPTPKPKSNNSHSPDPEEKTSSNQQHLPSKAWQLATIANFSKLRLKVANIQKKICDHPATTNIARKLPGRNADERWLKLINGGQKGLAVSQADDVKGPSMRFCLALPEEKIVNLLGYLSSWLEDGEMSVPDTCRWVFCLLACIERPDSPEFYSIIRQIARTLKRHRDKDKTDSDNLAHINLITCIIGRYFAQFDLADPFE